MSSIQSKGNGTQFDTESYTHDTFGNITKITTTPYGETPRVAAYKYDSSGRFLIESTDIEGLITKYEYDSDTTLLLRVINPYNQSTVYEYDTWNLSLIHI